MKVNIVVQTDGWILERLSRRLEMALPYVKAQDTPDMGFSINYYMSYAYFNSKSNCDIVFFSHYEPGSETLKKKWEFCVQNNVIGVVIEEKYREMLLKQGLKRVHLIKTGVNTSFFHPKTVVGVAGKTIYNPHRKGEDIVTKLIELLPDITFRLAGHGGDREYYLDMRNFYHGLDLYLSPERYGTSECIGEALACGIPVLARPFVELGSVKPPIYTYTDIKEAIKVINDIHNTKMEKWWWVNDNFNAAGWVKEHDTLFQLVYKGGET